MVNINERFDSLGRLLSENDIYYLNENKSFIVVKLYKNTLFNNWLRTKGIYPRYKDYHSQGNKTYKSELKEDNSEMPSPFITICIKKKVHSIPVSARPVSAVPVVSTTRFNLDNKIICCDTEINKVNNLLRPNMSGFAINGSFFFLSNHIENGLYGVNTTDMQFKGFPIGYFKHKYDVDGLNFHDVDGNLISKESGAKNPTDNTFYGLKEAHYLGSVLIPSLKTFAKKTLGAFVLKEDGNVNIELIDEFETKRTTQYASLNTQYLLANVLIKDNQILLNEQDLSIVYTLKPLFSTVSILDQASERVAGTNLNQFDKCIIVDSDGTPLSTKKISELVNNTPILLKKYTSETNTIGETVFRAQFRSEDIFMPYNNALFTATSGRLASGAIPPGMPSHASDLNPRSCAFTDENDNLFFMHIEGRQFKYGGVGLDLIQLSQICLALGARNMINLDGGGSAVLSWREENMDMVSTIDFEIYDDRVSKIDYPLSNAIIITETKFINLPLPKPRVPRTGGNNTVYHKFENISLFDNL